MIQVTYRCQILGHMKAQQWPMVIFFSQNCVYWWPDTDRCQGICRYSEDSGERSIWFSRHCAYWWPNTVMYLVICLNLPPFPPNMVSLKPCAITHIWYDTCSFKILHLSLQKVSSTVWVVTVLNWAAQPTMWSLLCLVKYQSESPYWL